jgi:hypothetical protein
MTSTPNGGDPELIVLPGGAGRETRESLEHLREHRRMIVRRALLATAVGGLVPIPVMDEYLSGRVRAGMLMKLAERRRVDLAQSSAELLGDPREGTAIRNATLTAATLLALKLAWRKFFALLAVGRRAEEMATTFQLGTLFDHFCAKMHVGAGVDRARASQLRVVIHAALAETERGALVKAFRDGGRVLGRSLMEAPGWVSAELERAARRWSESGGTTTDGEGTTGDDAAAEAQEARWLDRAAGEVEMRLSDVGQAYLAALVRAFERRWQEAEAAREQAEARAAAKAAEQPAEQPDGGTGKE